MRRRPAFTLIEVSLVIALTAIIFVAFILSVGSSIAGRRYSDTTQNFAEFLRNQYSAVINVQNNGFGNSNQAIYGRLITFGEKGDDIVYTYDIIGDAYSSNSASGNKSIITSLKEVNATSLFKDQEDPICYLRAVNETSYQLLHGAWLETKTSRNGQGEGERFTGSLIIARSPASGIVSTVFSPNVIEMQEDYIGTICPAIMPNPLYSQLNSFTAEQLDFCIGSDDQPSPNVRRDVRIAKDGKNSSAVQVIDQEAEGEKGNLCNS